MYGCFEVDFLSELLYIDVGSHLTTLDRSMVYI